VRPWRSWYRGRDWSSSLDGHLCGRSWLSLIGALCFGLLVPSLNKRLKSHRSKLRLSRYGYGNHDFTTEHLPTLVVGILCVAVTPSIGGWVFWLVGSGVRRLTCGDQRSVVVGVRDFESPRCDHRNSPPLSVGLGLRSTHTSWSLRGWRFLRHPARRDPPVMLTQGEDVEAHALRERGWSISAIARHLGHDRKTIRDT